MFASFENLPFLVKFRSHDMLDGGRAREAVLLYFSAHYIFYIYVLYLISPVFF